MKLPPFLQLPEKIGRKDHLIGFVLAALYVTWLLKTSGSLGFPRDEGFYFRAAMDYSRWFKLLFDKPGLAIQRANIDAMWGYNQFRFPGMCMGGIAVWTTYMFGARAFSRRAGLIAAALFAFMPRVFFNAHLACFDVPVVAMWVLTIYVYWRASQERTLTYAIMAGLVFGLALETKHNAWIIPAVVVTHAIYAERDAIRRQARVGRIPVPASIIAMAIIGPLVFYALWPWMWNDTMPRLQEYVNFHVNHEYYNIEFLGTNYFQAPSPRGYMPVMILGTVPAITLVLFFIGAGHRAIAAGPPLLRWGRGLVASLKKPKEGDEEPRPVQAKGPRYRGETDLLLALGFLAAISPWFSPKTPIFGGTKHWMTAYPFLAIFAGHAFDLACKKIEALVEKRGDVGLSRRRVGAQLAFAATVLAAPHAITVHSHPFGLSAYTPLVGGTQGAATIGLNRQFWGFTTQSAAPYFETVPQGSSVYFHDTAWDSWARMQDEKRIRPDLRGAGAQTDADIAMVHHELHMAGVEQNIWVSLDTLVPAYVVEHDGVPIVSIYARKKK
jgi:hypothetical protein